MNQYMTKKADPGPFVTWTENLVGIAVFLLLIFLGFTAVYGYLEDGFMPAAHITLLIAAMLLLLLLCWITDRKRARVHARVITSALCISEKGSVPFEELMKATRINKLERVINKLSGKGYIRNVAILRGDVCLTNRELMQAVCTYCGASMLFRKAGTGKCPNCGSAAVKYL